MIRRLVPLDNKVFIELDGQTLEAKAGEPVACAMLASDELIFSRSIKYHRPRGPVCMSGVCSNCLVRIDGKPNLPACRVRVESGMQIERQNVFPDARLDIFSVNDVVFPKWFNHHEFLAGVPIAQNVMLKVARQLAGLGKLPKEAPPKRDAAVVEHIDVAIIGAGPAGLSAARVFTNRQRSFVLFERDDVRGGRLSHGFDQGAPEVYSCAPSSLRLNAEVVGVFNDAGQPFLAVIQNARLHLVFPRVMLFCVGGHPAVPAFENNDLPGVFAARAVSRLIRRHQVLPGEHIAVIGEGSEARSLVKLISDAGGKATAVAGSVVSASGLNRVHEVVVRENGTERSVTCDAVACCEPHSPAFELARAAGASVAWHDAAQMFTVVADTQGRTSNPQVFAAGELRGPMSASAAAEQGLTAAETIVKERP